MNVPIPTRHPDRPRAVPGGIRLSASLLGLGLPTSEQWRNLGEHLTVGDEPMDRLVEWMFAEGIDRTRPMFDRALAHGIDSVPDAPEPLRAFFVRIEAVPDWVDADLLRRGQRALRAGGADGMYVARDVSLLGGYQFSGFNKTLLRGRVGEGLEHPFRRNESVGAGRYRRRRIDPARRRLPVHDPRPIDPRVRAQARQCDGGLAR
jgi:hypothetical protein